MDFCHLKELTVEKLSCVPGVKRTRHVSGVAGRKKRRVGRPKISSPKIKNPHCDR